MKKKIITVLIITLMLVPVLAFAAPPPTSGDVCQKVGAPFANLTQVLNWASCLLVRSVVPLLFTLATVAFIWGIIQYFLNPDNEEKRKAGKSFMIWGLIALFVMISMWGIVGILSNTFGVKTLVPQLSQ